MLRIVQKWLNIILFGNVYIATGALFTVHSTAIQLGIDNIAPYAVLVFFSTLFIYNLQRSFYKKHEKSDDSSVRREWISNNQTKVIALLFIGFAGILISVFRIGVDVILYLSPLLILSIAYFIPFLQLRRYAWVKLLTLVLVWTIVTAIVPVLLYKNDLSMSQLLIHAASRFCFMMAICIPFDIRDLQIDSNENISTLPQLLGESTARYLSLGIMLCHVLLIVAGFEGNFISGNVFSALLIAAFINTFFVVMAHSKRSEYFYVAGIDGTLIIQGALLLGVTYLF